MKHLKHLFTALLLLCVTVATAHDFEVGGIYYNITSTTDFTVEVTYRGSYYNSYSDEYSGNVVIPESVTYNGSTYSVTSIGPSAFNGCSGLTSVVIPNGVTSIGDRAFLYCENITSVEIPNSVTSIDTYAFCGCTGLTSVIIGNGVTSIGYGVFNGCTGLASVVIPNSVTSIGRYAFEDCSGLTSVEIPNSVISIGGYAFSDCSGLTSVEIPNSVTSIGDGAFKGCSGLNSVSISDLAAWCNIAFADAQANPLYYAKNLYLNGELLTELTIPESVTSIGSYAFSGCTSFKDLRIEDGEGVLTISDNAFYNCSFESVYLGRNISGSPFDNMITLKNLTIGNGVTSIGDYVFSGCTALKEVRFEDGEATLAVGTNVFYDCSLESVYLGRTLSTSSLSPFYNMIKLKNLTIGNGVTSIGDYMFEGCTGLKKVNTTDLSAWCGIEFGNYYANPLCYTKKLYLNGELVTDLVIPDGVTEIKGSAFCDCSGLTSVEIPNSVTSIGGAAFSGCSGLTSVTIGNNVESIGIVAFEYCSGLTSVEIPNSVTSIAYGAFRGCTGLTSVVIGNGVESIGDYAFEGCSGLKTVINFSSLTLSKGSGGNSYVTNYADKVIDAPNGTIEGDYVFGKPNDVNTLVGYLGNATEITLPADYNGENYAIGSSLFNNCSALTSVEIPNCVTGIGENAFNGCSGLNSVSISDLAAWCNIAFGNAQANPLYYAKNLYLNGELLTELTIPNNVTSIGSSAFYNCSGLTSVEIPESVTSIGNGAFSGCSGLNKVNISDLAAWCNIAFASTQANPLYYAKNLYLNGGLLTELTIPESVTSIGFGAFYNCSGLTSVVIPNGVTSIGKSAFSGCSGLTSVEIPNGVTSIGDYAFNSCSGLTSVVIPNSVTSIGYAAFAYCSGLTRVVIGNSVTSIGSYAFYGCTSLKDLRFEDGEGTLTLGYNGSKGLFYDCPLESVYLGRTLSYNTGYDYGYSPFYNKSKITSLTIGEKVTSIGVDAFSGCSGLTSIVIGNSVTSIGGSAFGGCSGLTSIVIGNSVTSIGSYAFYGCTSLKDLRFEDGEGTLTLGYNGSKKGLFYDCPLESVYLGRTLSYNTGYDYGYSPFYNKSKITSLTIGEKVTSIGSYAFDGCFRLTSVVIPNSVISIGSYAFRGCTGLTSVEIPNSVTSIGGYAFNGCSRLTSVTIGNSVTSIGNNAFYNCSGLKKVINCSSLTFSKGSTANGYVAYYAETVINAPNGSVEGDFVFAVIDGVNTLRFYIGAGGDVTLPADYNGENYAIGAGVFKNNASLTSVVIPNSVTSIGSSAFYKCSSLTSVVIPNSVTSIGEDAFYSCSGLTSVVIPNSVTSIGVGAFSACSGLTSVEIPNSVTSIGWGAFYNCSGLASVVIPNSVTSIGERAFYNCSGLASVVIPNSVTSIGREAFYYCSGLKEVHISDLSAWCGIDFDGSLANPLYYAHNLYLNGELVTDLVIPDGVTEIKDYAFSDCSALTSVVVGNSVTSIGICAFSGCTGLTSVVIPNSVTSIGYRAFSGCTGLTSVVIPNSVTSIGNCAFDGCRGLTNVEIPNSVTSIGDYAFRNCSVLTSVEIPYSVTSIGSSAFENCSGLKKVINFSSLTFSKGSTDYGYVAYYADTVINAPNGSVEGDFVFGVIDGVNTLCGYIGAGGDVTLPADYKGENYVIGADVFENNTSLTSVVIPNSVTSIGESAFRGCSGLKEVHISDLSAWCNIAFASADANPLYYAENLYLNDELLTELTIPDSVTEVKNFAFYNCSGLTSIEILDGVTGIGEEAFRGCSDLEYIYISSTIESIGDYAFAECNNIFDIKIGSKKVVAASENVFSSDAYNNACLYVPAGRKDFYAKTSPWSNFIIQEMDFTGIDEVKGENGKVKGVYYDLNGRAVERPANGLYIKNGKKVFVK